MRRAIRHLSRSVLRSPASAVAVVLTVSLTLGVGASIFSVVDAVVLTPPPFVNPEAVVTLGESAPTEPQSPPRQVRYATVEAWRERAGALAAIEASNGTHVVLTELGAAERLHMTEVTPGFLPLLGVASVRGRMFDVNDLGQPVVIVTDTLWRTKLAADPAVVGRQIVLGGRAHTVIGVLPQQFVFLLDQVDLFRPLPLPSPSVDPLVGVIARLGSHVSSRVLTSALDDVARQSSPPVHVIARPVTERIARGSTRTLGLLAGAATLAFLIAFTNLAGLLLVRSVDRKRELAVRMALGAQRSEVARQLFMEAILLVIVGVVSGVLLALWLTPLVGRLALEPFGILADRELAVSWRVVGIVALVAAVCAGLSGLLPASVASRRNAIEVLARDVTPAPRELSLRRVLVTGVIAVACMLLISLTLVGRSLRDVLSVNPGFDAHGVMTLPLLVESSNPERVSFVSALHTSLEARLGLRTVSIVNELPLTTDSGRRLIRVRADGPAREIVLREAGPAYFDVMRIPMVAGRSFDARDDATAPVRVVVSKSLAEQWFANEQPLGRHMSLGLGPRAPTAEIIGIVGDVKHRSLDAAGFWPTVYLSAWQDSSASMFLVVRSQRSSAETDAIVREEVARLAVDVPVLPTRSMDAIAAASPSVAVRRMLTATLSGFAGLALVLGAIGLFGVVSHDFATRRVELALRLALGAGPTQLFIGTLDQGARMVGTGLGLGSVLSIWTTEALSDFGFVTNRFDMLNLVVAAAVLMVVGAIAVLPTAHRASQLDPASALKG